MSPDFNCDSPIVCACENEIAAADPAKIPRNSTVNCLCAWKGSGPCAPDALIEDNCDPNLNSFNGLPFCKTIAGLIAFINSGTSVICCGN